MFNVPPSPYDLRFQIAGIPIRVHPLFWLGALVLGMRLDSATLILWMIVVFCSVLIHELGHALMMRYFGQSPHVVLYLMGGYASPRSEFYSFASTPRLSHGKQILVLLAGPGAGFALTALLLAGLHLTGHEVQLHLNFPFFWSFVTQPDREQLYLLIHLLLIVNVFWGVINLVPVYPLDGGQIARELFLAFNPWNGLQYSLYLSVAAGIGMLLVGLQFGQPFLAILFGYFAFQSYQTLQQLGGGGGGFGGRPW